MMGEGRTIDPDISVARTLPPAVYREQRYLDAARERIFAASWHPAIEGLRLAQGAVRPFTLLPGLLDEPLLFARQPGERLVCLSNVCTHRGNLLVTEEGSPNVMQCGYHGRCFDLDGRCRSMPGMQDVAGFPSPEDDLPRPSLAIWEGLPLVSLAPAFDVREALEPIRGRLSALRALQGRLDVSGIVEFEVAANWALYVDNYLEGLHVPFVHPALDSSLAGYEVETYRHANLQIGLARERDVAFELGAGHVDAGRRVAAYYVWLFPSTMINVYPWGVSLNVVTPLAVDRTRVLFAPFVADPALRGFGAGGALEEVERQDEAVVERVQQGMRSRLFRPGRFAPQHEQCVHHFHLLLAEFLGLT